jgi:hypothetical protein
MRHLKEANAGKKDAKTMKVANAILLILLGAGWFAFWRHGSQITFGSQAQFYLTAMPGMLVIFAGFGVLLR